MVKISSYQNPLQMFQASEQEETKAPSLEQIDISAGLPSMPTMNAGGGVDISNLDFSNAVTESTYVQDPLAKLNEGSTFSEIVSALNNQVIEDYAPDFIKEAYNKSIDGVMNEMLYGKKMFDVPLNDKGRLYDMGTQALSIIVPTKGNIAMMVGGGGFGGKAAQVLGGKKATEFVANQFIKRKLMPQRAKKSFVENVGRVATTESTYFATYDGLYGGALNVRDEVLKSEYDLSKFDGLSTDEKYNLLAKDIVKHSDWKDFAKGYGIGLFGAGGYAANRYTSRGLLGPLMPKAYRGKGVTKKGEGFGVGGEVVGGVTGAWLLEPEFRKVVENIEGGEVGLPVLMLGVIAASQLPGDVRNLYKTGKMKPGKPTKGMTQEEFDEAVEEGIDLAGGRRRQSDIYTRVQDPLIKVEGEILPESRPVYEIDSDGNPRLVGYSDEQSDLSIKRLNSRSLPEGMASGPYMNTSIKGNIVLGDGTITKEIREIPKDVDVKIDRKSLKVDGDNISFDVKAGRLTYRLDASNSELLMKFYTSQPGLRKKFLGNNKDVTKQKFAMTRIRRKTLRGLRDDSNAGKNGLKKSDFERAVQAVGNEYGVTKFQDPKKAPKISEMSDIEMRLVTEQFGDLALLKTHEDHIGKNFGSTLSNVSGTSGQGYFENLGRSVFGGLQANLEHPVSKTVLKMLSSVDRRVVSSATNRIVDVQKALGMDTSVLSLKKTIAPLSRMFGYNPFQNKNMENWIVGNDVTLLNGTKIKSAFDEYEYLQAGEILGKDHYKKLKAQTKKILRDSEKKGGDFLVSKEEEIFLKRRLKVFEDLKRINDPIYDDAIKAGIKVAGRQKWYRPTVLKKSIRDAIYTNMLSLDQKVKAIVGELSLDSDMALRNLDQTKKDKIEEEMKNWVEKLAGSKDKDKQAVASIWEITRDELKKMAPDDTVLSYDVWANINAKIYDDGFKTYAPLEKSRKFLGEGKDVDIMYHVARKKQDLLDKNILTLETDYINGATKTIELAKTFLPKGALFETLIKRIPDNAELKGIRAELGRAIDSGDRAPADKIPGLVIKEKDAIRVIKEALTGENAFNRQNMMTKLGFTIAEFEFMTKINLGTAVIPNMTQTFISTLPQLGAASTIRGLTNYIFNPEVRDMVKRSGVTALNLFDELLGGNRALQQGQARELANLTTDYGRKSLAEYGIRDWWQLAQDTVAKPFMSVNVFNKIVAGAAAEDYIIKLTKMLDGEVAMPGTSGLTKAQRKKYATAKLQDVFGLNPKEVLKFKENIKNRQYRTKPQLGMKKRLMGAMEKYAQDSQMGRNFELDALAFNDQYTKSLLLFKRFPIRQGKYMLEMNKWEVEHGNVLQPLYSLAYGATGGAMAATALDSFKQVVSGDRAFYGRREQRNYFEKINNQMKGQGTGLDFEDGLEMIAGAGMLGAYGDMLSNMDRLYSNLGFLVKPLIIDDIEKMYYTLYGKPGEKGLVEGVFFSKDRPADIRMRQLLRGMGPVFGSMPNNFMKRYHYSAIINPLTNEEIAAYPEGFERAKVQSMKSGMMKDINRKILFSYSDDGDPEVGVMPRKLKKYDDVLAEVAEQVDTWNNSIYVRRFPTLSITPEDYLDQDKMMDMYADFIKENEKYYKSDEDDMAIRGYMIDGVLPEDATPKQIERFLERQKRKEEEASKRGLRGILGQTKEE